MDIVYMGIVYNGILLLGKLIFIILSPWGIVTKDWSHLLGPLALAVLSSLKSMELIFFVPRLLNRYNLRTAAHHKQLVNFSLRDK
jgi:hypothetical protein